MAQIKELLNIISAPSRVVFGDIIEPKYLSDTLGRKKGSAEGSTQRVNFL